MAKYMFSLLGATDRNNTTKKLSTFLNVTWARIHVAGFGELRITLTFPGRPLNGQAITCSGELPPSVKDIHFYIKAQIS